VDLESLIENVLNAIAAGLTIAASTPDVYRLGLIFGIMKVVNFARASC